MENIATKKFRYAHTSSYKSRGRSAANRVVRAQRANEKRHVSRMDEISKRRRIPLSSLVDDNVVDVKGKETNGDAKENNPQPHLSRKEQLLKWREERKTKKLNVGNEKKSFVVRHVKYDQDTTLFAVKATVSAKGDAKYSKLNDANNLTKKATRVSARLAKQSGNNTTSKPVSHTVKHSTNKAKDIDKQNEGLDGNHGKTVRITRQSVRSKMPSCQEPLASQSKKVEPKSKNQVKTRSQMKMLQHPTTCPASSSETEEHANAVEASTEKTSKNQELKCTMPDTIKNTVSFGRGNAEGVERCQMSFGKKMRLQSFAPADFQFTAPDGINTFTHFSKTFKFEPLSPNSAEKFMFPSPSSLLSPDKPSAFCADVGAERKCQLAKYPPSCSNVGSQQEVHEPFGNKSFVSDTEVCVGSSEELRCDLAPCAVDSTSTDQLSHASSPNKQDIVTEQVPNCVIEMNGSSEAQDEHHGPLYFRDLVKKETERLNKFCNKWERINGEEQDLREEDRGQIRTTIGQAQLLIDQRFRQFSGLIDLSEDKEAEKQATTSDLQGFWDMIYFQIEDVNAKFDALEKLKENNWQEEVKKVKKAAKRGTSKKPTSIEGSNTSSKTAASKSRIQTMRNALKAKMAADRAKLKSDLNVPQEEEAFITILTPMKRSKKTDETEVVLTPVRRSNRKTPQKLLASKKTPVVVTTPKKISDNSPGLRLTPQITDGVNDEPALPFIGSESKKPHDNGCNMVESELTVMQEGGSEEERMECDDDKRRDPPSESSCKSPIQYRKTPGKVTFQSPGNLDDDCKHTPGLLLSAATEVECDNSAVAIVFSGDSGLGGKKAKRSTARCISARKCRGRTATPYNNQRLTRRISEDERDGDLSAKTDSETASDAESGSTCAAVNCVQGSQLRRSTRRTPSKYRDPTPKDSSENELGKTPLNVSVKLFCAEESEESDANNVAQETTSFSRYLCPSLSDEEENTALASTDLEEENAFEEIKSDSKKSPSSENLNLTAGEPEEPPFERTVTASESRPSRTPLHLLQYLSDMETPSPNSRLVTPMPKTTLFISPPGSAETAVIDSSLILASPENVVNRFPAKKDGVPLVSLTPGSHALTTAPGKLPLFHLDDSPANVEKRRDSVFFAPTYSSEVRVQDNLMLFSPVHEVNEEEQA